jgi:membrane protein DedA with SNARE-associated domain
MSGLVQHYGLIALFLIVMLESGGIPLPGETALVAAGVFASQGKLNIVEVIAVAAVAAIVGDNIGYWIGRTGGRKLLDRSKFLRRWSEGALPWAESFFQRHGPKTIFIARFFSVLRVTAAWMAGISRMHWLKFFAWNAAGGICWAVLVGLLAYYVGHAATDALSRYGLVGGAVLVVLVALVFVGFHLWKKRLLRAESGSP